ncbi:protein of unknown function (plasmid) [Methylocella tundrae]|uniref:Uncharacterized protein n=1 Tax=Methylocella tundrae TaxID=227605 RepID=A0A4V6IN90_METTU|nr:protein of unknown function [Methylocella tundrae]
MTYILSEKAGATASQILKSAPIELTKTIAGARAGPFALKCVTMSLTRMKAIDPEPISDAQITSS